jgi:hypothetical protein
VIRDVKHERLEEIGLKAKPRIGLRGVLKWSMKSV